ncbi:MAG TPA: PAS domain-containing protein [Myxococcus sp.]|nr:PAS domain-containing protein [Myxococcus sp.]
MPQPLFHRLPSSPPPSVVPEEAWPFLGALLNAGGSGLAFLDRDLKPLWVNATLASLSGLEPRACVGRPLTELWPQVALALAKLLSRALAGEEVVDEPVSGMLSPSAGVRHLRVGASPALRGGELAGAVLWVRDDTERVLEEQRLREREEHLRGLTDVSCDGYLLHENGRILEASRAAAQLLGLDSAEQMKGRSVTEWVAPESYQTVRSAMERGVQTPYEITCLRKDGQRIPLEVLGLAVTWEGRPARLTAVWDISTRRAAELGAAHVEHFRDQLLGVVGADLRKPLSAIQLSAGALQRLEGLEAPQQQLVTYMSQAARRMDRMIQELMDFTRARLAGGLPLRPEPALLSGLVGPVVEECRRAHPGRPVKVEAEGDLRGVWDGPRLAQLVDNLLGPALQHGTRPDMPVTVKMAGSVGGVTVAVSSPGWAIPADEHATLFEPFRGSSTANAEGLGLGLFIARQIALAHGGRLTVESCGHGGVRFIVWLPREAPRG